MHDQSNDYTVDVETGCWTWRGSKMSGGYAKKAVGGRSVSAHRWYYEQAKGSVPEGLEIDHLCRNRACVNPGHLEAVTSQENNHRGDGTKLTWEQVREIRAAPRGYGTGRPFALKFGVSDNCIWCIRNYKTWKEVI